MSTRVTWIVCLPSTVTSLKWPGPGPGLTTGADLCRSAEALAIDAWLVGEVGNSGRRRGRLPKLPLIWPETEGDGGVFMVDARCQGYTSALNERDLQVG